jgi:hypothetical protein
MIFCTSQRLFETGAGERPAVRILHEDDEIRRVVETSDGWVAAAGDGTIVKQSGTRLSRIQTEIEEIIHSVLVLREAPLEILLGTEPPHLYRVHENAIERIESFDHLECRRQWNTPWGGPPAVRTLAASGDGWVYADIHVGSIMRSGDYGHTWLPVTAELDRDVHQVTTCPAAPNRTYAQTAHGFYLSEDRGETWLHRIEGMGERYGRCVAVAPENPDLLLASVSDGPHDRDENVHGQLYRSEDAGQSWRQVTDGFPKSTSDNINSRRIVFDQEHTSWVADAKDLYVSRDEGKHWQRMFTAEREIVMVTAR